MTSTPGDPISQPNSPSTPDRGRPPAPSQSPAMSADVRTARGRGRTIAEIWIVLALAVLPSAALAIVQLTDRLTRETALADQTATLNPSLAPRPVFDASYQLIGIAADLVPVALVIWLLWAPGRSGFRALGLDLTRPGRDVGSGLLLALAIGVPGLGLYLATRALGLTPAIATNAQELAWWTVMLLVLSAVRAGLLEEVVVVGYLQSRLGDLGWGAWPAIVASALVRGSYHLYQGVGMALGNVAMGILFGWWYQRTKRTAPLVVAHILLDIASFIGYYAAVAWFGGLFI